MKNKLRFSGIGLTPLGLLCTLVVFLGFLLYFSAVWYLNTYGNLGFDSILYTLTADLSGVESTLIASYLKKALLKAVFCTGLIMLLLIHPTFVPRLKQYKLVLHIGKRHRIGIFPFSRWFSLVLSLAICVTTIFQAAIETELTKFLYYMHNPSTFYDSYYRSPEDVDITFPEKKRNLIYIFMESMEVSFASQELGGALDHNAIPELCALAEENISFSHTDQLGGPFSPTGTTWTIAAMVGQTAGVPLKLTPGGNETESEQDAQSEILPAISNLSTVLRDNGYTQALMVGSDVQFGGRYQYYKGHGTDLFFDHASAMEDGIIPEGYSVWWGFEDLYLYQYARQEITRLAQQEEPFAFTMLTVDTHHVGGYPCSLCEDTFMEQYENVYHCASRQVYQFIRWIQAQDFYEDTAIVICGDHASMDADYFTRNVSNNYDRRVYNCFINSAVASESTKNRQMSVFDMFPSTLAAIGCQISGERLGLGTNLFSDTLTLSEEMGQEKFNDEVSRYSVYYMNHFY